DDLVTGVQTCALPISMNKAESLIFLAHGSRLVGPLNAGQLKQLRETGEIQQYFWLWEDPKAGWVPANSPPPPPPAQTFIPPSARLRSQDSRQPHALQT